MQQRHTPQRKFRFFSRPLLLALIVLIVGGPVATGLYLHYHDKKSTTKSTPIKTASLEPTIKVPTHTATSEGSTFQVPNNVSKESVKNYQLITDNDEYKIRELGGTYTITIYAIINNPSQTDSYHQQLHDYKQAALTYLTQHNIDVNKVPITYDPAEAAHY